MGLNSKVKNLFVAIIDNRVIFCSTNLGDFRKLHNEIFPNLKKSYTYFKSSNQAAYLQFVIRKVGPRTTMFEVYKQGKGRIAKSGVFDRAYDKLCNEVDLLNEAVKN